MQSGTSDQKRDTLLLCEWLVAGLITAIVLGLHALRIRHGGALWRDEVAALNLARMPWRDVLVYFPHEAFPLFFPALLRAYTSLSGTGVVALRLFGFCVGALSIIVIWWNARITSRQVPLIALALLGFNPIFFFWGDSIRGYGLGAALIILAFGLFARIIIKPSSGVFWAALLSAVLSVQCLLANAVLLFAMGTSATLALLFQRRTRHALIVLGIGCVAALSLLPYFASYQKAREWDMVLRNWLSFGWLWGRFCHALANPGPTMFWIWLTLLTMTVVGVDWLLRQRWDDHQKGKGVVVYASLTFLLSLVCYAIFLRVLGYPTQDWYYLALIAVLIVALEVLTAILAERLLWFRLIRLTTVLFAAVFLMRPVLADARARMTTMDLVAQELTKKAVPDDLIIILPWYLGISFRSHYHSHTPWSTLPPISDLRVHRYDLGKEQMSSADPLGPLLRKAADTLRSGHRLWVVSPVSFSVTTRAPHYLAPAPWDPVGWDEESYRNTWSDQLGYFIGIHALRYAVQEIPSGPTNGYENPQLMEVEGLRDASP